MESDYIVELRAVSKHFGGVHALNEVDLELRRGEIMGIVGDNGAGKSTLMKVLSGAYVADEGEIRINGEKVRIRNPQDAADLGISMIYQDLALFNNFDVAKNIFVGRELTYGPFGLLLDKKRMYKQAEELIRSYASTSGRRSRTWRPCPAASARWSPARAPSPSTPRSSSWTSRRPRSA